MPKPNNNEIYLGEREVDFETKPHTLADLVRWALDKGVAFDKVEFFAKSDPYEPPGAFGSIDYHPTPYARVMER